MTHKISGINEESSGFATYGEITGLIVISEMLCSIIHKNKEGISQEDESLGKLHFIYYDRHMKDILTVKNIFTVMQIY